MVIRKIGVFSAGKISGSVYALMGLLVGILFSLFALLGAAAGFASDQGESAVLGLFFGVGAVVILPVFYGAMGFICGLVGAALYNLVARMVGGLEIELEGLPGAPGGSTG